MSQYPLVNSHFNPETDEDGYIKEYVIKKDHNFSIAIDSKDGLTVPNIKKVQEKSILKINEDIIKLREKAEKGQLTAADFDDSTFSISSVGNLGGTYFVPTILRP
jgi:2-oxoisovalerate dehydrogenase E2 component (dihydrolipoyl transacylase)